MEIQEMETAWTTYGTRQGVYLQSKSQEAL
jgi:hypothetical protein